ncbi:MAG: GDP-mannose 4,6-dehydratase [Candidatus Freyarchaeum deiterrae]
MQTFSEYEDKIVLVTGGAGFIGSHLVKKMLDIENLVHVADNFSIGRIENITIEKVKAKLETLLMER